MDDFESAEAYFGRAKARESYHTIDDDFKRLKDVYLHAAYRRMFVDDYSAMAEERLKQVELLATKTRAWSEYSRMEHRQLRMIIRWLRRDGVTEFDYETLMPEKWEDVASLMYLSYHPAVRIALPALTDYLWW